MADLQTDLKTLEEAMRRFFQVMKRQQMWSEVVSRAGIPIDRPAANMLRTLVALEPETIGIHELASQLGVEAPSVSRKAQELEEAGLVKRQRDEQDRRAVRLVVTAAGHKVVSHLWKAQREIISETLSEWSPLERKTLVDLLNRFSHDLSTATKSIH